MNTYMGAIFVWTDNHRSENRIVIRYVINYISHDENHRWPGPLLVTAFFEAVILETILYSNIAGEKICDKDE